MSKKQPQPHPDTDDDKEDIEALKAFLARSGEMGFPADILHDAARWRAVAKRFDLPLNADLEDTIGALWALFVEANEPAAQWRELVRILRLHGWTSTMITPERIVRRLPWMWS